MARLPAYFALGSRTSLLAWKPLAVLPGIVLWLRNRREPAVRDLLAWAAATWLCSSGSDQASPYGLPAIPPSRLCVGSVSDFRRAIAASKATRGPGMSLLRCRPGWSRACVFVGVTPQRFGTASSLVLYATVDWAWLALRAVHSHNAGAPILRCVCDGLAQRHHPVSGRWISSPGPRLTECVDSPRLAQSVARHAELTDPPW